MFEQAKTSFISMSRITVEQTTYTSGYIFVRNVD